MRLEADGILVSGLGILSLYYYSRCILRTSSILGYLALENRKLSSWCLSQFRSQVFPNLNLCEYNNIFFSSNEHSNHFSDTVRRATRAESWTLEEREAELCRSW